MEQSVTGGSGIHCPNSESQSCTGVHLFKCGQVASLLPHMTIEISYESLEENYLHTESLFDLVIFVVKGKTIYSKRVFHVFFS